MTLLEKIQELENKHPSCLNRGDTHMLWAYMARWKHLKEYAEATQEPDLNTTTPSGGSKIGEQDPNASEDDSRKHHQCKVQFQHPTTGKWTNVREEALELWRLRVRCTTDPADEVANQQEGPCRNNQWHR